MYRIQQYIFEVYKERSFSRAAQNLFISQSSLSTMVIKHERELGIQIFDRGTSPISLTDAGEIYIESIRKILDIEQELDAYLKDYNNLKTGRLVLGAPHFFSCFLLPPLMARFHQRHPGIQIKLAEADSLRLYQMLLQGEIELMVESAEFDANLFTSYPLIRESLLLAVPKGDPVNRQLHGCQLLVEDVLADRHLGSDWPSIPLQQFQDHKFLLLEKGHDMHTRAFQLCREQGFEPQSHMKLNQLMTSYNLTNQQMGVSFVSDTVVKLSGPRDNIFFYRLEGVNATRQVYIAHKRSRYVSMPMRKFIELATQFPL